MSSLVRYGWLDEPRRKKRKAPKWGPPDASALFYTMPKCIPYGLTVEQTEALLIRFRVEEITRKINLNELNIEYGPDRSPSPEPVYDMHGKRVNTREQRAKEKLNSEWQRMIEMAMAMSPQFKPPADYNPATTKKQRKIYVPTEKFPEYNFIGLILGPRGATQKEMEKETGAKILIRGKGSVKDGKSARKDGKTKSTDDEPLHVLVIADTEDQIERASAMVARLLVPVEEGKNEHKRQQLRMLAMMNGTLRDRENFQLTERTWDPANVKCSICGEQSHPTSDCPFKGKGEAALPPEKKQKIESEYDRFFAEIEGMSGGGKETADPYDEFMKSIKTDGPSSTGESTNAIPPWAQPNYGGSNAPPPWAAGSNAPAPWQQQSAPAPWSQPAQQQYPGYSYPPWQQPPQ